MKLDIMGVTQISFLYLALILLYIMVYAIYFKRLNIISDKVSPKDKIYYGLIGGVFEIITSLLHVFYNYQYLFGLRSLFLVIATFIGSSSAGISYVIFVSISRFIISGFTIEVLKYNLVTIILLIVYRYFVKNKISTRLKWIICCLITEIANVLIIRGTEIQKITSVICIIIIVIIAYKVYLHSDKASMLFLEYENAASRDYLTKLFNVRSLHEKLNDVYLEITEDTKTHTFAYMDIDYFKNINDTYGHAAGDLVLQSIASIIQEFCREDDIVARKGGEEFCVILRYCKMAEATEVLERIRKEIEQYEFKVDKKKKIKVTISIGTTELNNNNIKSDEDLINKIDAADKALYKSKSQGRNRITIY